jgi:pimeloyl-ACP methyl ester carboxylesterase
MAILLVTGVARTVTASAPSTTVQPGVRYGDLPPNCEEGRQGSGAEYRICTPTLPITWNGDLVVYAHGYVAANRPVEIPEDQMVLNGLAVDQEITDRGYAFATTSYATNGLAVLPAISDLLDLVDIFTTTRGIPNHIYLVGVSEGGLVTTLSVEQHPDVYDGGLAMCGPYGDFSRQTAHFGDFRVVFDYFFPGLMPGSPLTIPDGFMETWESGYFSAEIEPVVASEESVGAVDQLLSVTDVSPYTHVPPTNTEIVTSVIENLLWYNVFATEDGKAKLGGQPYDNQDRWYRGSDDDAALNAAVERFSADAAALEKVEAHYQTSGELSVPLVTLHTTGDPVVPYWHATRYRGKTIGADNIALHQHFKVERHGHCSFDFLEILAAFNYLVDMVENPPPYEPAQRLFLPVTAKGQ